MFMGGYAHDMARTLPIIYAVTSLLLYKCNYILVRFKQSYHPLLSFTMGRFNESTFYILLYHLRHFIVSSFPVIVDAGYPSSYQSFVTTSTIILQ